MTGAFGIVVEQLPERGAVRVELRSETDGAGTPVVSGWLQALRLGTSADKSWWLPDVGEHVACLFFEGRAVGVVLGSIDSAVDPPGETDPDVRSHTFSDGTVVRYDRGKGRLEVRAKGAVEIVSGSDQLYLGGEDGAQPVPRGDDLLRRIETIEAVLKAHKHPGSGTPPLPADLLPLSPPKGFLSDHTRTT